MWRMKRNVEVVPTKQLRDREESNRGAFYQRPVNGRSESCRLGLLFLFDAVVDALLAFAGSRIVPGLRLWAKPEWVRSQLSPDSRASAGHGTPFNMVYEARL